MEEFQDFLLSDMNTKENKEFKKNKKIKQPKKIVEEQLKSVKKDSIEKKSTKYFLVVLIILGFLSFYYKNNIQKKWFDINDNVEGNNLIYNGRADIEEASKDKKEAKKVFWTNVKKISALKGDPVAGEAAFAMCLGCHMEGSVNMGGVTPPSLDHAGTIYDKNFLIALIKNPAIATNVDHKYVNTALHPMGSIMSMVSMPQDIANVVSYIKAKKSGNISPKEAYIEACSRCHSNLNGNLTQLGEIPTFNPDSNTQHDIRKIKYNQKVAEVQNHLSTYLGVIPPDLSKIYMEKSENYLETYIENPQSRIKGASMPRVGLNHRGIAKILEYLKKTSKKEEKVDE